MWRVMSEWMSHTMVCCEVHAAVQYQHIIQKRQNVLCKVRVKRKILYATVSWEGTWTLRCHHSLDEYKATSSWQHWHQKTTIFCHELSNNQPIILFPLTAEPFSATSRCTVSCSSTDCRIPTLPRDDKQCAFWNIAICWTEVHSRFCAVTAQHTAQSVSAVRPSFCSLPTAPVYLAITASEGGADVFERCCAHDNFSFTFSFFHRRHKTPVSSTCSACCLRSVPYIKSTNCNSAPLAVSVGSLSTHNAQRQLLQYVAKLPFVL